MGVTHYRPAFPSRAFRRLPLLFLATLALYRCDFFDIFPPEIEIVSPREDASCVGTLSCDIDATDNRSVAKVELFLDNVSIHEFTKAPYKADLDISGQSAGTKTFKAIAYDQAGNHAEKSRYLTIWAPILASSYDTPGYAWDVFVSGNYAYVADGYYNGLQVINVSNAASPTLAGTYDTPGWAQGVFVSGSYAYVADKNSGLQVINVSNPASPTPAGSYNTPGYANGVFVSGSYAYVAGGYYSGLLIFDVSGLP